MIWYTHGIVLLSVVQDPAVISRLATLESLGINADRGKGNVILMITVLVIVQNVWLIVALLMGYTVLYSLYSIGIVLHSFLQHFKVRLDLPRSELEIVRCGNKAIFLLNNNIGIKSRWQKYFSLKWVVVVKSKKPTITDDIGNKKKTLT